MKSFKQFLKEEINKEKRQAQNIVGAKQKQMKDEECERPVKKVSKKNKKVSDEDAENINSTPSATPTGEVSPELTAAGVPIDQDKEDESDNDVVVQQVLDILNQSSNDLDRDSQQEYAVRKQRFDELMKQINDVIAQSKAK